MKTLKIRISTNQVGTAIDYWQDNDWRCLELFRGELNQEKVRRDFAERAEAADISYAEVKE